MGRPSSPRGQGRARVVAAAVEVFSEQGVSGASLQMIADRLGVTKAAVYYQFQAKDDIVIAVLEPAFAQLRGVAEAAEAALDPELATDIAVQGMVDLVVDHRDVASALFHDPEIGRVIASHPDFSDLIARIVALNQGPEPSNRRRIATSVLVGLAHAGVDPDLADIDADVLRAELVRLGRLLMAGTRGRPLTPADFSD